MELLSIIGAITGVLGCIMGGISLYLHWRSTNLDQAKLKVSATMGLSKNLENPETHPFLKITLRNEGRRLVYIRDIWIQVPGAEEILVNTEVKSIEISEERINLSDFLSEMPIALKEHEMYELDLNPFSNTMATHLGSENVFLKVEDSLGIIHAASFMPFHVPAP